MLIRRGECTRCGECCKIGAQLVYVRDEQGHVKFSHRTNDLVTPCVMLLQYPDGTTACKLHHSKPTAEDQLKICYEYPISPQELVPGCGFYFEEVTEEAKGGSM